MLPEQVRKQVERANALIEQQNGQKPTGEPSEPPAPEPNPEPPAPAPAPAADAPAPAPAPTPTDPTPAPQEDPNSETWRQKYLTLQGVINAEGRRYQDELRQRDERLAALGAEIAALKATPAQAPAAAPKSARQFSQDEVDRFGPELLNLVMDKAELMADEIVTRKLAEFTPAIERVESQVQAVGRTVYASKEQEFWGELQKAVADFQAVNAMPEWRIWLGQEDDMSGLSRQAILESAQQRLDHGRVAKLFNAFKRANGLPVTGEAPAAAPAAPASAPAPAAPQISPSPRTVGTGSGPTPREPEAPSVKRSEISAHYRKSSTDPTYRTSTEYAAMEQRIMQAQAAGRVLNA